MKQETILSALNGVNDRFILDAGVISPKKARHPRSRAVLIVLAAAMTLLLMGAGVAATLYGDSIQHWFAHSWAIFTGQTMTEDHASLLDHLSQEIGVSQTVDGVTVTVDSATVGDDNFFVLLRVDGFKCSSRYGYGFDRYDMNVQPDPVQTEGGLGSFGVNFVGMDGDGAVLLLLDHDYATPAGFTADAAPLQISLTLRDFCRNPMIDSRKVLAIGEWSFTFTLDRSHLPQPIVLPSTQVEVQDTEWTDGEIVSVSLTDIQLTNTGLRFWADCGEESFPLSGIIKIALKDGTTIDCASGAGTVTEDKMIYYACHWPVPLDLEQVSAIQIGNTKIAVP